MKPAGYSGTPLPRKLGLKEGARVGRWNAPAGLAAALAPLPRGARLLAISGRGEYDLLLAFAASARELHGALASLPRRMAVEGALWLCWPKQSSGVATDITGSIVRSAALAVGLVDIKICAVDETWSGLKCVFRVKDREALRLARRRKA